MKPRVRNLINVAMFYVCWFGIVLSAPNSAIALPLALTAVALFIYCKSSQNLALDLRTVVLSLLLGVGLDYVVLWSGAFSFITPIQFGMHYPLWMICLWIIFGTTLRRSLYRVVTRPFLGGLFGALGGPLSYLAAEALHVLSISQPRFQSLFIIGLEWLSLMIAFHFMLRKIND